MSIGDLSIFSYGVSALAYTLLAVLVRRSAGGRIQGVLIGLAVMLTALWAGLVAGGWRFVGWSEILAAAIVVSEMLRDLAWLGVFFLLNRLVRRVGRGRASSLRLFQALAMAMVAFGVLVALVSGTGLLRAAMGAWGQVAIALAMVVAILGLTLVERFYRATSAEHKERVKGLCFGIGGVFAYDFFLYSEALLYGRVDPALWGARGVVNAIVVPMIAVSIVRNPDWSLDINVSRSVVYHSTAFIGSGIYLLVMAAGGAYLREYGGSWGGVAQVVFMFVSALVLLSVVFSDRVRAYVKVFINKHFYSHRYDYREEWLKFTRMLSEPASERHLNERIVQALAGIVGSRGGALWVDDGSGSFTLRAVHGLAEPDHLEDIPGQEAVVGFVRRTGWVVDVDDLFENPDKYEGLVLPECLVRGRWAWLLIPLNHHRELLALLAVAHPPARRTIDWEDCDILKTAGNQAAIYIAQSEAARALVDARQFEALNQLSAFIIHDLKNLLSQLSLLLQNGKRHGTDPEFVEDMLATVENSVQQMNNLLHKLKTGWQVEHRETVVELGDLVRKVIEEKSLGRPVPRLERAPARIEVEVDRERLATTLSHIVQNAQDATPDDGEITVRMRCEDGFACIDVDDTGTGMSPDFVRDRLFRPFASTKGRSNMGIGVYEARQFLRKNGGDLTVRSRPGEGSCFTLRLPLQSET